MSSYRHLDLLLHEWPFDADSLGVRLVKGRDGRNVILVRVDLGVLQLETDGRPDGIRPNGAKTYLDYLKNEAQLDPDLVLDDDQCMEADREFVQFYHRRISWLRLQHFRRAVEDADHTLELMDVCQAHSPDEDWTMSHEQYRPFVMFHRTQAAALASLEEAGPEKAVTEINLGLEAIRKVFADNDAEEHFEEDELVVRLSQLRESLREQYDVGQTLREQLEQAVASEQYELAARLRDEMSKRDAN